MPSWPTQFPQCFIIGGGFDFTAVSNTTALDTESGEPLTRRRFTGAMVDTGGTLPTVNRAMADDIYNFWLNDCKEGSLRFVWTNPLTLAAAEMIFMEPPSLQRISGPRWSVSLKLRILP